MAAPVNKENIDPFIPGKITKQMAASYAVDVANKSFVYGEVVLVKRLLVGNHNYFLGFFMKEHDIGFYVQLRQDTPHLFLRKNVLKLITKVNLVVNKPLAFNFPPIPPHTPQGKKLRKIEIVDKDQVIPYTPPHTTSRLGEGAEVDPCLMVMLSQCTFARDVTPGSTVFFEFLKTRYKCATFERHSKSKAGVSIIFDGHDYISYRNKYIYPLALGRLILMKGVADVIRPNLEESPRALKENEPILFHVKNDEYKLASYCEQAGNKHLISDGLQEYVVKAKDITPFK